MVWAKIKQNPPEMFNVGDVVEVLDKKTDLLGVGLDDVICLEKDEVVIKKTVKDEDNNSLFLYLDKILKSALEFDLYL